MPVEIKELIVRTNIVGQEQRTAPEASGPMTKKQKREIIDACVEKVIKHMERKRER